MAPLAKGIKTQVLAEAFRPVRLFCRAQPMPDKAALARAARLEARLRRQTLAARADRASKRAARAKAALSGIGCARQNNRTGRKASAKTWVLIPLANGAIHEECV